MWWCMHLIQQRQKDLYEFKASLVCILSSRMARTTHGDPVCKENK